MKKCPKCKKSYSDDLNFCLDDGFSLRQIIIDIDASEEETKASLPIPPTAPDLPVTRAEELPPTHYFPKKETGPKEKPVNFNPSPPITYEPSPKRHPIFTFFLLAGLFLILGVISGAGLFWILNSGTTGQETSTVTTTPTPTSSEDPDKTEKENPSMQPEKDTPVENEKESSPDDEDIFNENDIDLDTPTPTPKSTPVPVKKKPKGCYLHDGGKGGGEVRVRRYCDNLDYDCAKDRITSAGIYPNGTPVEEVGYSVRSSGFTWVRIRVYGRLLWVASTKIRCS